MFNARHQMFFGLDGSWLILATPHHIEGCSSLTQLSQSGIANTKMMSYFVLYYSLYFSRDLGIISTCGLDRPLKYGYFIRHYQTIVDASLCEGHPFIEAKQSLATLESRLDQLTRGWLILHDHSNIFQPDDKLLGQSLNRPCHKPLKPFSIHRLTL